MKPILLLLIVTSQALSQLVVSQDRVAQPLPIRRRPTRQLALSQAIVMKTLSQLLAIVVEIMQTLSQFLLLCHLLLWNLPVILSLGELLPQPIHPEMIPRLTANLPLLQALLQAIKAPSNLIAHRPKESHLLHQALLQKMITTPTMLTMPRMATLPAVARWLTANLRLRQAILQAIQKLPCLI